MKKINVNYNIFFFTIFIFCLLIIIIQDEIDKNLGFIILFIIIYINVLIISNKITLTINLLNVFILLGSVIIISTKNLFIIYMGLEIQTFSLFILLAVNRTNLMSIESSIKFFIFSAISTGIFLMGLYLYSLSGSDFFTPNNLLINKNFYFQISIVLMIISLTFKLGLFPFHFWISDVYQGSTWEIIGIISLIPKISIIIVLIQFNLAIIFQIIGIGSIIIGTLGALNQTKIKRFLAYSGINTVGYIVTCFILINENKYTIIIIFIISYFINFINLLLVLKLSYLNFNSYIIDLYKKIKNEKLLLYSITIILFSMTGIPPLIGFIPKWFLINNLINENYFIISLTILITSVISAFYYCRIINIVVFLEIHNNNNNNNNKSNKLFFPSYLISVFTIFNFSFIFFYYIIILLTMFF